MIRAGALAVLLACAPAAAAQVAPAQPVKPSVAKPAAPSKPVVPPVAPSAKPPAPARLASLQADLKSVDAKIAALKAKQSVKDGISQMTADDMRLMQQLMDQKSQLETMISNTMKATSDTQDSLTAAQKAS
jgi:hypothetical protein